jgi:hypothetical protein
MGKYNYRNLFSGIHPALACKDWEEPQSQYPIFETNVYQTDAV